MHERLRILLTTAPVLLLAIASILLFHLWNPLPAQMLRNTTFDQFQRWKPRAYTPVPVRIVAIDEASLEKLGQWPWPRTLTARLVQRLRDLGAAAIVFDVIYAEADRTSPVQVAANWELPEHLRQELQRLADHDQVFADAIRNGHVVLGQVGEQQQGRSSEQIRPPPPVLGGFETAPYLRQFAKLMQPIPALSSAAAGLGVVNFVPDTDGVVRRLPLMVGYQDQAIPTLSAEALRVAQGLGSYQLSPAAGSRGGVASVRIGEVNIPTTPQAEVWLYYAPQVPERTIPAWQVLEGHFQGSAISGNIVLIGATALGLYDLRFSPLGGVIPGVQAHAQFLEQALSGVSLQRPDWAESAELLLIMVGGLVLGVVAILWSTIAATLFALICLAAVFLGSWTAFSQHGLLLDPSIPSLALLLSFVACSIIKHRASERREEWVRDTFSHYVSPNLVDHLVDDEGALAMGGERRVCSFVFTDLAGFTPLMESLDPADVVELLNDYIDGMIRIAFEHEGTLDRIVGDAVAIMFSAPVYQADHADRALRCAMAMHLFSEQYASSQREQGIALGRTRIGVHSGEVLVGNFGGSSIVDYRALGDPINTAARLEGVNKYLGTLVCLSADTIESCLQAPNLVLRPVGRLILKGRTGALMTYQPKPSLEAPDAEYEHAYRLMESGEHDNALHAFEELQRTRPEDPLVNFHLERLRSGNAGIEIRMTEK